MGAARSPGPQAASSARRGVRKATERLQRPCHPDPPPARREAYALLRRAAFLAALLEQAAEHDDELLEVRLFEKYALPSRLFSPDAPDFVGGRAHPVVGFLRELHRGAGGGEQASAVSLTCSFQPCPAGSGGDPGVSGPRLRPRPSAAGPARAGQRPRPADRPGPRPAQPGSGPAAASRAVPARGRAPPARPAPWPAPAP